MSAAPARRAIVEHRYGPGAPQRVIVEPGTSLRVGRTSLADLVIPNDGRLAGVHLSLHWDGERCRLHEHKGTTGTELAGEPVHDAWVAHGDYIRAGDSVLMVYFERHTPPALDAEPADPIHAARALDALRAVTMGGDPPNPPPAPLYGVLDTTRGLRVRQLLCESIDEHRSLYEGVQGDALADAAPYLVRFARGSDLLERLVTEGWGRRWGIYLTSRRPFREVRTHLRRFLMVTDDRTEERLYFRFYDPRTLRVFLPGAPARQAATFFGEIDSFVAEGERGEPLRFAPPATAPIPEAAPC